MRWSRQRTAKLVQGSYSQGTHMLVSGLFYKYSSFPGAKCVDRKVVIDQERGKRSRILALTQNPIPSHPLHLAFTTSITWDYPP